MSRPRAVLWDVDGTLVDSSGYHWPAWRRALAAEGFRLTRADFDRTFGLRNDSILRLLLGDDVTPDTVARVEAAKEADYRRQVRRKGIVLLPGAADWPRRLAAAGWLQAVCSSAPAANVELVLEVTGLGPLFDLILSGADAAQGKPDPEIFLTAADRLGVDLARCVVVEDAPAAIRGAHQAGLATIGTRSGMAAPEADVVVAELDQLAPDAFDRLVPPD